MVTQRGEGLTFVDGVFKGMDLPVSELSNRMVHNMAWC